MRGRLGLGTAMRSSALVCRDDAPWPALSRTAAAYMVERRRACADFIIRAMSSSITDVAGIAVGHFTDARRPTGCTVVIARQGAVAGVDVRGAAPGTRETDLLAPGNVVEQVHAVLLAGGSAFGLDAASGVMQWLDE